MSKQKGQALVEFALIVPFFLLLIFGLIYSGMLFHDYSSLSNTARTAAREAALIEGQSNYTNIQSFYLQQTRNTLTSLYRTQSFTVTKGSSDNEVYVRIRMARTVTSPIMNMVLPPTFDIVYFMKKETPASSSSSTGSGTSTEGDG